MNNINPKLPQRKTIRFQDYDYSQAGLYFITLICQDRKHLFGKVRNGKMILSPEGQIAHDEWLNSITIRDNIALHDFVIMPDHIHVILEILYSKSIEKRAGLQSPSQTIGAIIRGYKGAVTKAIRIKNQPIIDGGTHTRPGMGKGESHSPDTAQTVQTVQTDHTNQISQSNQNNRSTRVTGECNSPQPRIDKITQTRVTGKCNSPQPRIDQINQPRVTGERNSPQPRIDQINQPPKPISIWQRNYYEHIIRTQIAYQRISQYIINNPKKWSEKYGK